MWKKFDDFNTKLNDKIEEFKKFVEEYLTSVEMNFETLFTDQFKEKLSMFIQQDDDEKVKLPPAIEKKDKVNIVLIGPKESGKTSILKQQMKTQFRGIISLKDLLKWNLENGHPEYEEKIAQENEEKKKEYDDLKAQYDKLAKQAKSNKKIVLPDPPSESMYKCVSKTMFAELLNNRLSEGDCRIGCVFDDIECDLLESPEMALEYLDDFFVDDRQNSGQTQTDRADVSLFGHEVCAHAFAGYFHETELAERCRRNRSLVLADGLAEFLEQRIAIFLKFHIDKVDHHETADIAQAELLCDFIAGVNVRFENDLFLVFSVDLRTRVHIDGNESFGLIDDEVTAVGQRNRTLQGTSVIVFDFKVFEEAFLGAPKFHLIDLIGRKLLQFFADGEIFIAVVDINVVGVIAEIFADRLGNGIRFLVNAGFSRLVLEVVLGGFPLGFQFAHLLGNFKFAFGKAVRAHNVAHIRSLQTTDHFLEFATLLGIAFALRNADKVCVRHTDEESSCKAQMRRQTGALGADRFLDHLHHDFLPFVQNLINRKFFSDCFFIILIAVFAGKENVPVYRIFLVKETGLFKTDVNKRGFQRGKHFLHDTFIDITEDTVGLSALDNEFSEVSAFHHGDSLFVRCHANQNATLSILNSH